MTAERLIGQYKKMDDSEKLKKRYTKWVSLVHQGINGIPKAMRRSALIPCGGDNEARHKAFRTLLSETYLPKIANMYINACDVVDVIQKRRETLKRLDAFKKASSE